MSSNFSSTKAYRGSVKRYTAESSRVSRSSSLRESSSGTSTSTTRHSETSNHSSKSSPKDSSKSSSTASSKTSSKHSSKASNRHIHNFSLPEISVNGESHEDISQPTSPAIRRYIASPTRSNLYSTFPDDAMTTAQYQAQMQSVLNTIDTQLHLGDSEMDLYDAQVDQYETQLELDEGESEES